MPQPDDARVSTTTVSGAPRRRVSISSHREQIKRWVGEGYSDQSIAEALGTTPSSVQSFRSRAGIRRQPASASSVDGGEQGEDGGARSTEEASTTGSSDTGRAAQAVYEGVLDGGEQEGYGLWLDPAIAGDPLFERGFTGVTDIRVVVQRHRIVLTPNTESTVEQPTSGSEDERMVDEEAARQLELITDGTSSPSAEGSTNIGPVEQGQVKWFNTHKGYGFILRPDSSRIFFHVSELAGGLSPEALAVEQKVSYEVGDNQRGLVAKAIKLPE